MIRAFSICLTLALAVPTLVFAADQRPQSKPRAVYTDCGCFSEGRPFVGGGTNRWHSRPFCSKGGSFGVVYFAPGSVKLDAKARRTLDRQAACIKRHNWLTGLYGSTDGFEISDPFWSLELGERRIAAVAKYLRSKGVSAHQIGHRFSLGWFRPVAPHIESQNRWQNRYVLTQWRVPDN